jgi:sortase A
MNVVGGHRLAVVLAAVSAIAIAGSASIVAATRGAGAPVRATAPVTTTRAAPRSTTTTAPRRVATTTLAPPPMPENPPSDPYADVPVRQIGTITIPKIGLVQPIFEGIWLTVIDHGPGHWPGSAVPGQRGNTVFAGHRVTHTHPFENLDQLLPGDRVVFTMPNGVFTYAVTRTVVVKPDDLWVVYPTSTATMTLFACHPKHSAAERIVVKGKLVHSRVSRPGRHS